MTQAKAPTNGGVAIVLSGAGARGAYEAGALSVLLPFLKGDDCPRMVLGTSAGALNAAILASYLHLSVDAAAAALLDGWRRITPARVFSTPRLSVLRLAERRLRRPASVAPGLLDTGPLRVTLGEMLPDEHLGSTVTHGSLDAVAVAASSCTKGGAVVFLETTRPVPMSNRASRTRRPDSGPSTSWPHRPSRWPSRRSGSAAPPRAGASTARSSQHPTQASHRPRRRSHPRHRRHALGDRPGTGAVEAPERHGWQWPDPPRLAGRLLAGGPRSAGAHQPPNRRWGKNKPAAGTATPAAGSGRRVVRYCALNPSDDGLSDVAARVWPLGLLPFVRSLGGYGASGPLAWRRRRPGQFLSYLCFTLGVHLRGDHIGDGRRRTTGQALGWDPLGDVVGTAVHRVCGMMRSRTHDRSPP